jgi:hypothetical protein
MCIGSQCFASARAWACAVQSGAALDSHVVHDTIAGLWSLISSVMTLYTKMLRILLEDLARSDTVPMLARLEDEANQNGAHLTVPDHKNWTLVWGHLWLVTNMA